VTVSAVTITVGLPDPTPVTRDQEGVKPAGGQERDVRAIAGTRIAMGTTARRGSTPSDASLAGMGLGFAERWSGGRRKIPVVRTAR
jgi:hypothetical protein